MKKRQTLLFHLLFWLVVISMTYSFLLFSNNIKTKTLISSGVKLMVEIIDFYLYYILISYFIKRKKKLKITILVSVFYAAFYISFYTFCMNYTDILLGVNKDFTQIKAYFLYSSYYAILYMVLALLLKLAIEGNKSRHQKLQLQEQNIKSELALLRSQVNPHFLFNVLNTIHSFVNNNSPKASQAVIKLSDIMRYMLHEANRESIQLEKEIEYLQSYITLQNLRFEKPDFVDFNIEGDTKNIWIPPMIFTPFIENAFKHGKMRVQSPGIIINLSIVNKNLFFYMENHINTSKPNSLTVKSGVGLKNVKRRLKLLFPGNHKLEIKNDDKKFMVSLKINLP